MAIEAQLADGRVLEFPDGTDPSVIQATVKRVIAQSAPQPEQTVLGNVKELVKGVLPGAVGLVESAATGASALLPEEMEKAAREKIKSVATSAKQPFAAATGYEESVGRRLGEGLGSIIPSVPLGFLGAPGVAAGIGMGLASGAGEARTRAEEEGATAEQRKKATALGTIPGGFDTAVDMALAALPGGIGKSLSVVRRALVSGGVEGATEAAQAIAQNAIAKGLYKPSQSLIEGSGEEGAYGAGVGVLASVLLDMAVPGRRRGAQTAQTPAAAPQAEEAPAAPEAPAPVDLTTMAYPELVKLREELKQQEKTPETREQIKAINDQLLAAHEKEIETIRADKVQEEKARKRFPGLAEEPAQKALFPEEELVLPEPAEDRAPKPLTTERQVMNRRQRDEEAAQAAADAAQKEQERKGGQYRLPLRSVPEGKDVRRDLPIPARPTEITMQDLEDIGVPMRTSQKWLEQNVIGKTPAEIQVLVGNNPDLLLGTGARAQILKYLTAPVPEGFKEEPSVTTPAETNKPEPVAKPRGGEPSVGVPSEPASTDVVQPRAGVPTTPRAPTAPVRLGLAPVGQPAGAGATTQAAAKPSLIDYQTAKSAYDAAEAALDTARVKADKLRADYEAAGYNATPAMATKLAQAERAQDQASRNAKAKFDALQKLSAPAVTPPAAPAAPAAKPAVAAKPAPKAPVAKKPEAPAPAVTPEAVETETAAEEAARKAEAEDMKRRLEALEKKVEPRAPATPTAKKEAPKAEKPEPKELPEKLREPVGTSEYGMEEGEVEIQRGPQGMLFPMSKREEREYAERKQSENDKKEEVGPAPKVDTRQMDLVFPETIAKAINGKTILEAANWGAKNFPDADQRMIAMRVAATLRELQSVGVTMGPFKVTNEGDRLTSGAKGIAIMSPGKNNTPSSIRITVNHYSNGDQSGVDPEGVLHELIHAATMGAIQIGNKKSAVGTRIGKTVGDLYDVVNAVFAHVDAKHARGETLNETEKKLRTPYMRDVDEVLAWTMTNRDMQAYMETVPYKNTNLWTKFVESVRKILGLTPKADTALSEILRVGGELTEMTAADLKEASTATGRQFSVSASTESLVDSMGPLDAQTKSALGKLITGVKDNPDIDYVTKARTQVADIAATIEQRLRTKFDGAVRDSMGKLNPMGLYRQAQDYSKMLLEYFQTGTLYKDPTTGLWMSGQGKGVRPPAEVYALLDKYAEKNGYSRERATQIASRILEGVRLNEMRASNKTGATSFALHLNDAQIDQLMKEYNADPDLKEMSKLMDEARKAMVDNLIKVGRLTPEQGKEWKEVVGYVPFDRIEDFATNFNKAKKISGKGIAQLGKLPELIGSEVRPVGNVFDNYINTLGWMVGQTLKTDATTTTLRSLEDLGFAKYLGRSALSKPNAVGSYVNGEMYYWNLPSKYDVMAFKDLNAPKAGWLRAMGQFSNVLRKTVTVLPPFALKQVTDDVQRAILTSGVKNPGALVWMSLTNFPKLALAELRGIQHPYVKEFGRLGLTGEYDFEAGKPAISLLKDLGYKQRGRFETILHRLDGITRASDLAVRKAIYDQTIKESGDALLAQTRAREFINFRRRGASDFVGAMVTTVPFFNAYIQGMDVLYRAASGKDSSSSVDRAQARQMFWSRAATVMMLSSLYALGKDDEDKDYQEMDLRTRDGNWILPGGYKIPVPGELGAIFKVIPERVVEYMKRQGTPEEQTAWEATRTTLAYMYEQYLGRAVPVPQAIKPVIEAWSNKSFLTGRDLEGYHHKAMDPSMRTTEQTSELAKAIAVFSRDEIGVEVSPIMVDNALRGYFGSSAAMFTMVTDSLLNPTRVDRPLHKYALLSNYMYDPVGTRRMTEFYEEREKVGKANTTLNELMKTDLDRAEKYADEHAGELMMESAINSTLEQLERTRAYRKYLNSVEGANDMSKEDREAELKEIKQMELEFVQWVREAKTELRKVQ